MSKSKQPVYICKDVYLKGQEYLTNKQIKRSLVKNRSNLSLNQVRAALQKSKKWPPNIKTITVKFLEGPEYKKAWVEKVIKEQLEPYCGLTFVFSDKHSNPMITITFKLSYGAYSYVGTDCLQKQTPETMNLGWVDPPGNLYGGKFTFNGIEYEVPPGEARNGNAVGGTVLHEFGHAIGLIHEHQNPTGSTIQWDIEKVYQEFSGPPNNWGKAQIDHNILNKYDETQLNTTQFDPKSIMLYFFPPYLTTNGVGTQANFQLSDTDKKFIEEQYPVNESILQEVEDELTAKPLPEEIPPTEEIPTEEMKPEPPTEEIPTDEPPIETTTEPQIIPDITKTIKDIINNIQLQIQQHNLQNYIVILLVILIIIVILK